MREARGILCDSALKESSSLKKNKHVTLTLSNHRVAREGHGHSGERDVVSWNLEGRFKVGRPLLTE